MDEEYWDMKVRALELLRSGQSLTGKDGAFAPLLKQFIETAPAAQLAGHLDEVERSKGNKLNGKGSKTLRILTGDITIETPQDWHSSFSPGIVKKRETVLADNLAPKIIGLYGLGMIFRDIASHIEELYDVEILHTTR